MEGGVSGVEKDKREEWKRKETRVDGNGETVKVRRGVLWKRKKSRSFSFKKVNSQSESENVQTQHDFSEEEQSEEEKSCILYALS